jgi:hypothetical protein
VACGEEGFGVKNLCLCGHRHFKRDRCIEILNHPLNCENCKRQNAHEFEVCFCEDFKLNNLQYIEDTAKRRKLV